MRPPSSLPGSILHLPPAPIGRLRTALNRYRLDSNYSLLPTDILVNSLYSSLWIGSNVAFGRLFKRNTAPLTGAPVIRRMKTYSAQTGYVYRYYYEGYRIFHAGGESGVEFLFRVSAGPKGGNPVTVRVAAAAVSRWEEAHSRQLSSTERYAIAKMALFQAFDERPTPSHMKDEVNVRHADLQAILDRLDL